MSRAKKQKSQSYKNKVQNNQTQSARSKPKAKPHKRGGERVRSSPLVLGRIFERN